ncbi:hypothetical protein [Nocardia brasiliensis]|uniref:hypothetical protein n=1 Tax=Nocardia brasiliensis TaxID=37326 RepID=UPI00366DB651
MRIDKQTVAEIAVVVAFILSAVLASPPAHAEPVIGPSSGGAQLQSIPEYRLTVDS